MKRYLLMGCLLIMICLSTLKSEPTNEKLLNDIDIAIEKSHDIDMVYINTFDGLHIMDIDEAKNYIIQHPYDDITLGYRHCMGMK